MSNTETCINARMQLNIGSLNRIATPNIEPFPGSEQLTGEEDLEQQGPNYYIALTISRDNMESSDDLSFTCASNYDKVR